MNDIREILSKLWLAALGRSAEDRVEGHEKFFERGGDSMAAIRLYAETEETFTLEIDPTEFMGTLAEKGFDDLVKWVQEARTDA